MKKLIKAILAFLTPSPATQWDMAARNMRMEGYTDLDILQELGPRPKD